MEVQIFVALAIPLILSTMSISGFLAEKLDEMDSISLNQLSKAKRTVQQTRFRRSSKVCYGEHGCFSWRRDFYHIWRRPIMYNPYFRISKMKYDLYTRTRKWYPYTLKRHGGQVRESPFNPKKPTKIIVHGWSQFSDSSASVKPKSDWVKELKDALLERDDLNVIVVNWTVGSDYHYMKAAPNARLAGADIALMVKYLKKETEAKPEDFHVIGNSLGAQVAGYVGARLRKWGYTLGRITGLDPAEEYFQWMPVSVRLDPSDAKFVDVIHTNGGYWPLSGLGIIEPSGHLDFYVNGGRRQPGCNGNLCSHGRAHELFISSVKRRCSYQATRCYNEKRGFSY